MMQWTGHHMIISKLIAFISIFFTKLYDRNNTFSQGEQILWPSKSSSVAFNSLVEKKTISNLNLEPDISILSWKSNLKSHLKISKVFNFF